MKVTQDQIEYMRDLIDTSLVGDCGPSNAAYMSDHMRETVARLELMLDALERGEEVVKEHG